MARTMRNLERTRSAGLVVHIGLTFLITELVHVRSRQLVNLDERICINNVSNVLFDEKAV